MEQDNFDYQRMATAIDYLKQNYKTQPDLDEAARQANMSPTHFQRVFTEWVGVSPKKFVQYLSLDFLRSRIYDTENLNQAADIVGLSAQSRVYDLFVKFEGVTPQEFKTGGRGIEIQYGFHPTPFGECLIGITERGVCHLSFVDEHSKHIDFQAFSNKWQSAKLIKNDPKPTKSQTGTEGVVQQIFEGNATDKLHVWVQGTNFQMKVWEALLTIPQGAVTTYQHIANAIGKPKAVRAVGTAIGNNPIAFLIPCHRVIRRDGIGEYHWGNTRKCAILGWEAARSEN